MSDCSFGKSVASREIFTPAFQEEGFIPHDRKDIFYLPMQIRGKEIFNNRM